MSKFISSLIIPTMFLLFIMADYYMWNQTRTDRAGNETVGPIVRKSALVLFYLVNSCVQMKYLRSECFIWPLYIFIRLSLQGVCTNLSYYRLSS